MTRISAVILFAILLSVCAYGDGKTEAELRARLAAAEAARITSEKDKAALTAAINKLNAAASTRAAAAASTARTAVSTAQTAADTAETIASEAKSTAETNAAIAQRAAEKAALAAALATAQADQLQRASDRGNFALLVTQVFGFAGIALGLMYKAWTDTLDRRERREDKMKQDDATAVHRGQMISKLSEVKNEAHNAYKEANTVNLKIAEIGLKVADGTPLNDSPEEPKK